MKALSTVLLSLTLLGAASAAWAQDSSENAAYRIVAGARNQARRFKTAGSAREFQAAARRFLTKYPDSARTSMIHLWMGDLLKGIDDREAYRCYEESNEPVAAHRAAAVAFRYESPPPLEVERWLDGPFHLGSEDGTVKALVFFSESHPQTRDLLPHIHGLHQEFGPRGLRLAAIAAVVDDHRNQQPDLLERRLRRWRLPFPVAIDKQRPSGAASVTLQLYQGRVVPWLVLLDRYGRIAWVDNLMLQGNGFTRLRKTLESLLEQPTYPELVRRVRKGDVESFKLLASIRTRATAAAMIDSLKEQQSDLIAIRLKDELLSLLPKTLLDEEGYDLAIERWSGIKERYRYSFPDDRLVAK